MDSVAERTPDGSFDVVRIEEDKLRSHVAGVVRDSVEQTLNGLLEAEADELCGAQRYERSLERLDSNRQRITILAARGRLSAGQFASTRRNLSWRDGSGPSGRFIGRI
jgi:Transposase, Mutator family